MVDKGSLESVLAELVGYPWRGRAYRVMLNDYPPDRENTLGARWNPPDVAAIYACLEPSICIAEVEYGLSRQSRPVKPDLRKTLYQIDVTLSAAVDLVPILPQLSDLGVGLPQLFADDMKVSQEIGRIVTWLGFDGLIVPSARAQGKNLVIYPGRATESYRFEIEGQKQI